jgi:hypothetical protein
MITGAHTILFSKDADADRAFFKDVFKYRFADAGHGWLIFALPPGEIAFHPSDGNDKHELYLMCDDVQAFVADMTKRGVATSPLQEERWGVLTAITLPSGSKLGVYQPRHASPLDAPKKAKSAAKKPAKKSAAKKPAKKVAAKKAKKRAK